MRRALALIFVLACAPAPAAPTREATDDVEARFAWIRSEIGAAVAKQERVATLHAKDVTFTVGLVHQLFHVAYTRVVFVRLEGPMGDDGGVTDTVDVDTARTVALLLVEDSVPITRVAAVVRRLLQRGVQHVVLNDGTGGPSLRRCPYPPTPRPEGQRDLVVVTVDFDDRGRARVVEISESPAADFTGAAVRCIANETVIDCHEPDGSRGPPPCKKRFRIHFIED